MHSVRSRWRARIMLNSNLQNNLQMTETSSMSLATTVIRKIIMQMSVLDHWETSIEFQFHLLLLQKMKKSWCRLHTVRAQYKSRFRAEFSDWSVCLLFCAPSTSYADSVYPALQSLYKCANSCSFWPSLENQDRDWCIEFCLDRHYLTVVDKWRMVFSCILIKKNDLFWE